MIRGFCLSLAVGMVILWLVGLGQHATGWLTWLNGLGALLGFVVAAGISETTRRAVDVSGPIALAIGLGLLWIAALATRREAWLTWWTFAFACAFLLVGIFGGLSGKQQLTRTTPRPA